MKDNRDQGTQAIIAAAMEVHESLECRRLIRSASAKSADKNVKPQTTGTSQRRKQ